MSGYDYHPPYENEPGKGPPMPRERETRRQAINEARVIVAAEQSRWDASTCPEVHQACVNIGAKLRELVVAAARSTGTETPTEGDAHE